MLGLFTALQSRWLDLRARWTDERGAVATEYGLLLVLVAIAIIGSAAALGFAIAGTFDTASGTLNAPPVAP